MSCGSLVYTGGFMLPDLNAAAHRVVANGKILRALGYHVVFLGLRDERTTDGCNLRRDPDYFDFECWSFPRPASSKDWAQFIVGHREVLEFFRGQIAAGIVAAIFYNYPAVAQMRLGRICQTNGVKQLSDATEWYDAGGGSKVRRAIKSCDTWLRMHVVHRFADGVLTTSKYLTDYYSARGRTTFELPTLYDADLFPEPSRSPGTTRTFIYVGSPFDTGEAQVDRRNVKERLDLCIQLFHGLWRDGKDFRFDVYGIEARDYLRVYPEHERVLVEMESVLIFHGRKPHGHVIRKIAESDVSIFFRDETRVTLAGFPSKVAESITCGTPVLTNNMLSLNNHQGLESLIVVEPGQAYAAASELIETSLAKIDSLKLDAYGSRHFDYRRYSDQLGAFLDAVGI